MRVLVIGGTRFIGPPTIQRLVDAGHHVTVFHRGETEADTPGAEHVHGERKRLREFRETFARLAPDVVLDMATMNASDAQAVLDAVRGVTTRVVMISSVDVYRAYGRLHGTEPGNPEPVPLTEDAPLRGKLYPYRGKYGGTLDDYDKIPAERTIMSAPELRPTVLRLGAVHGEGDYQHRLFGELARMDRNRPILLSEDVARWRWSRAYVGNVADAIALAACDDRATGRVYNVAEPETPNQLEWIRELGAAVGWDGEIVLAQRDLVPRHLRPPLNYEQDLVVDSARIRRELGYVERVSRAEWLVRAAVWERAHPPEPLDPRSLDFEAEDEALSVLRNHD